MVAADHPRTMLWPQVLWRLLGGPSADLQNHSFATLEGIGGRRRRSCRCEGKGPRLQLYADGSRRGVSANDQHDAEWGLKWGQRLIGPDDLDSQLLIWGIRQHIDREDITAQ